ncbi:hypothetical protein EV199_0218 [Pseudobacter ginsenosidimutans]|uniref:Uncharacterized protein n=1 Tax=Pseudobacter ginsenosidimutans TaxID=661488 RepID=A0A4Q7MYQ4_9BACT|nr:hypothetical protein EV199_0218 [Pseudobacter ginsenosidimutans]
MKNQLYHLISVLTVVAYFLPIAIVAIRRLWKETTLLVFAAYWALSGFINITDKITGIPENVMVNIGIIYNMLDMPLVIAIYCFTTKLSGIRNFTRIVLPIYLLALCLNPFFQGLNYDGLKYLLGLGLILVFTIIIWDLVYHLRKLEHSSREKAQMLIDAALLFQYGTYVIIYIFDYFWVKASNETDNFIIYYISSIVALTVGSCAYLLVRRQEPAKSRHKKIRSDRNSDERNKSQEDSIFTTY